MAGNKVRYLYIWKLREERGRERVLWVARAVGGAALIGRVCSGEPRLAERLAPRATIG